jgi:hypothetical protein
LTQVQIAEKIGVARQIENDGKRAFIAAESISAFYNGKNVRRRRLRRRLPVKWKPISLRSRAVLPQGYAKWSVRLLAVKCVALNYIDSISFKSVQRVLKNHNLNRT